MDTATLKTSIVEFEQRRRRQRATRRATASDFNVYRLLGVERLEVEFHSKLLADLLDPAGSHGQGSLFLDEFLSILRDNKFIGMTSSDDQGSGYFVELERDKIDINIYKPRVAYIGIENKIGAAEQPNQLWRYWKTIESKPGYPTRALVFLTPTGRESTTANGAPYFRMSYREHILDKWLPKCLGHKLPASVHGSLIQYKDTIRRMTNMKSVIEQDELAQYLAAADKLELAFEIVKKIEHAKTLLQGRFWDSIKIRLENEFRTDPLDVKLSERREANPAEYNIGCDLWPSESVSRGGALYMCVYQEYAQSQLYFGVGWPSERSDYQSLSQRPEVERLIDQLKSVYGTDWWPADRHWLGWVYRNTRLRDDEVAKRLARDVENVVSDVVLDFATFAQICLPHLKAIRV